MKYVVMKDDEGRELLFMFPRSLDHDAFAENASCIKDKCSGDWERIHRYPVSAGFVDNLVCRGRSETLSLDSRPEDTELLLKTLSGSRSI